MKSQEYLYSLFLLIIALLYPFAVKGQNEDKTYSVKNRWTVKASISPYKTAFYSDIFVFVGDDFFDYKRRSMTNFKIEANYGITKFIEAGIFAGFQHYEYYQEDFESYEMKQSFAPLFGVNANFHILPFFVKSKKNQWDLYLTTKYGGCYLPHKEFDEPVSKYSKYRQEYGLGLGIGYYFKNIIGIFIEGSIGQFDYFRHFMLWSVEKGFIY